MVGGGGHWICIYFLRDYFWEVQMRKNEVTISKEENLYKYFSEVYQVLGRL